MTKMKRIGLLAWASMALGQLPSLAQAGAIITIQGRLVSITRQTYVVRHKKNLYHIDRSRVRPVDAEKIDRPEVDVSLAVPFEAVQRVTRDRPS